MYERSAIVLERYFEKLFGLENENNLKLTFENYGVLIDAITEYQKVLTEEEITINNFEKTANIIQGLQLKQEKLYNANIKNEEDRNKLFHDLEIDAKSMEEIVIKIEKNLDNNNEKLKNIREEYVKALEDFNVRQKERKVASKKKRIAEKTYFEKTEEVVEEFKNLNYKNVLDLQNFIEAEKDSIKQEIENLMIKNGKNEKIGFNKEVIKKAVETRIDIATNEAKLYITIYDKLKKLLQEVNNDNLKLNKYQKTLKDTKIKLLFLEAKKEYIFSFLDNERITVINGQKAHKELMKEACQNFDNDIIQINNLYELILMETTGKATKKAYKDLYNKTYLKEIEEKEKSFEKETNKIKIKTGAVINYNYWRIDEIKNIYHVFQDEVTKNFGKDLSEFRIEDKEDSPKDLDKVEEIKTNKEKEQVEKIEKQTKQEKKKKTKNSKKDKETNIEEENREYLRIYTLPKRNKKQKNKMKKLLEKARQENKKEERKNTIKKESKKNHKSNKKGIFNKFFKD